MFIVIIAIFLEFLLCNLIINPTDDAEHTMASLLLLGINIILVCFAVSYSIKNEENPKEESVVKTMIFSSFFLRIAILFWDIYARNIFILPNSEGDAEWYHINAVKYAFGSLSDAVDYRKYSYYVGQLFKFIGVQKITVQFLHIFFAICSIILIYKILIMFKVNSDIRRKAIAFACFLPNLMMITTFFLQESIISFMIILSLYLYTRWWFGKSFFNIIGAVIASIFAAMLHLGGIVVIVGILALMPLTINKKRIIQFSFLKIIFVVLAVFGLLLVISTFGEDLLGKIGGQISSESITGEVGLKETGGGAYVIGIPGLPASLDLIINTPIRMIYFVFSPLPWAWRGLSDILAFCGSALFFMCAVYFTVKALAKRPLKSLRDDSISSYFVVLVVIVLIASIMFGWGVANAGSALRHREKFTYLFIVLFAISKEIILRTELKIESEESVSDSSRLQCREVSTQMR